MLPAYTAIRTPRAATLDRRPANRKDIVAMHPRSTRWLCLLALLAVSASSLYAQAPAATQQTVFVPLVQKLGGTPTGGAIHTGEATYYSEANGGGNCSFDP